MRAGTEERRPPLTEKEAADYAGFSVWSFRRWRVSGGGPVYIKKMGTVRYDPTDLDEWLKDGKRRSTSDMAGARA